MMRCMQLAKKGLGTTYPNPLVGAVVVYNERILGEGWHRKAGEPHAEVIAIQNVKDKSLLKEATLYVNLEPCSHFGKTPPCANLIVEKGLKKVVIGSVDLNPKVSGNGIKKLKEAGCEVVVGVCKKETDALNKRFFTFQYKKRPFIILKWAETKDGFIAPLHKNEIKPVWISNTYSRQLAHKMRAEEQVILIGTKTALQDNPSLTTRDWQGGNPLRVLIDKDLKVGLKANVFDASSNSLVVNKKRVGISNHISYITIDFSEPIAQQIVNILYAENIQSLIIEGGTKTLQTFIDENLWDETYVFKGATALTQGIHAPRINEVLAIKKLVANDALYIYKNPTY